MTLASINKAREGEYGQVAPPCVLELLLDHEEPRRRRPSSTSADDAQHVVAALDTVEARVARRGRQHEYRQMKAEVYRVLLRVVTGHRVVDLAEEVLSLPWP